MVSVVVVRGQLQVEISTRSSTSLDQQSNRTNFDGCFAILIRGSAASASSTRHAHATVRPRGPHHGAGGS